MSQHDHDTQDEAAWRRDVVAKSFESVLSAEDMQQALHICEREFPPRQAFSASAFCQRLTTALPHITLSQEARLRFLRALRIHEPINLDDPLPAVEEAPPSPEPMAPPPLRTPGPRAPRKPSELTGVYQHGQNTAEMGAMIVENISLDGACMQLLAPHALTQSMTLHFQFRLDDQHCTVIRLTGEIRWVKGEQIGVVFDNADRRVQTLIDYMAG